MAPPRSARAASIPPTAWREPSAWPTPAASPTAARRAPATTPAPPAWRARMAAVAGPTPPGGDGSACTPGGLDCADGMVCGTDARAPGDAPPVCLRACTPGPVGLRRRPGLRAGLAESRPSPGLRLPSVRAAAARCRRLLDRQPRHVAIGVGVDRTGARGDRRAAHHATTFEKEGCHETEAARDVSRQCSSPGFFLPMPPAATTRRSRSPPSPRVTAS